MMSNEPQKKLMYFMGHIHEVRNGREFKNIFCLAVDCFEEAQRRVNAMVDVWYHGPSEWLDDGLYFHDNKVLVWGGEINAIRASSYKELTSIG